MIGAPAVPARRHRHLPGAAQGDHRRDFLRRGPPSAEPRPVHPAAHRHHPSRRPLTQPSPAPNGGPWMAPGRPAAHRDFLAGQVHPPAHRSPQRAKESEPCWNTRCSGAPSMCQFVEVMGASTTTQIINSGAVPRWACRRHSGPPHPSFGPAVCQQADLGAVRL